MDPLDDENDCFVPRLVSADTAVRKPGRPGASSASSGGANIGKLRAHVVQLYYSRTTAFLYLGTFTIAGVLLATALGMETPFTGRPRLLFLLETLVTLSLIAEVGCRAAVLGWDYLRSWSNALDSVLAAGSAGLLLWEAPREIFQTKKQEDVELSMSLVMVRILVQFGRVIMIAEHAQRARQAKAALDLVPGRLGDSPLEELDLDFSVLREQGLGGNLNEDDGL